MFRPFSLPVRLAILVAGTMLPLILFAASLVYSEYIQDKQDALDKVRQVTRANRLVLDRQLQGIVSGLGVLANSRALAADDFENFRISATAFITQYPGSTGILLGDHEGRTIFVSSLPKGAPLPARTERSDRDEVFRTGKPSFSRVFLGSVSKRPVVVISVPVMRDGQVIYDMAFSAPLNIFQRILEQQRPSEDWTMSIFDQTGRNIARLPNPEGTVGQSATPQLLERMFVSAEAQFPTVSREGTPLLTAVSRSELSGWVAVSGVAEQTLTAPLLKRLSLLAAIGALLLGVGLAFALRMAGQVVRAEALHTLLINELNHRVKNTLSTVQSMAAQTFRGSADSDAREKFNARLVALGAAHDLLSESRWAGADLRETLEAVLAPFQGMHRITLSGPPLRLNSRTVTILSMVIQELATNATKYGALAHGGGRIMIGWERTEQSTDPRVVLRWVERDGPAVKEPVRSGFGSTLIRQGFAAQLGGSAHLSFDPDGLVCVLEFPLR